MRVRAPLCPPYSSVAQLVEPSAVNRRVGGSFPPAGAILDSYSNTYMVLIGSTPILLFGVVIKNLVKSI